MTPTVVVIGQAIKSRPELTDRAGVAGLSTALVIARRGCKVTVVAQHVPGDLSIEYTSPWAVSLILTSANAQGAQWLSNAESLVSLIVLPNHLGIERRCSIELPMNHSGSCHMNILNLVFRRCLSLNITDDHSGMQE
jgi:hypothetical protein